MTVIVLGMDALEFELVEKYKLKHIQQKAYTKLSLEDFDVVVTPPIWASMLTGIVFEEMMKKFIPIFWETRGFLAQIKNLLPWRLRPSFGNLLRPIQRILERSKDSLDETWNYLHQKQIPTIFDEFKSLHTAIPGYEHARARLNIDAFKDENVRKRLVKGCNVLFEKEIENLFEMLSHKAEYDLIFWYTNWLDHIGHLEQGYKLKIMERYLKINFLVRQVQEQVSHNDIIYIISDHGMIPVGKFGLHSNYGFFSSSTGEIIRKPQELYILLKKHLTKARAHSPQ